MNLPQRGSDWGRLAGYVVLSLVLYYLNVLFFLFAVPLQVLYARKGRAQYLLASAAVLVGIALFSLWRMSAFASGGMRLTLVAAEVVGAFLITGGLYVVNGDWRLLRRRLYGLLVATCAAGLISLPFVLVLATSTQFAAIFRGQVAQVVSILNASFGGGATGPHLKVAELATFIRQGVLSNYLFMYFLILTATWRIGSGFASRMGLAQVAPLSSFIIPAELLWPILVMWAGVLAGRILHSEVLHYISWGLAMVGAFLYGLQGVGIVEHLFARFKVARGVRILLTVVVVVLLLIPGVATIVLIAFPILGISELWIHYGRGPVVEQEERDE